MSCWALSYKSWPNWRTTLGFYMRSVRDSRSKDMRAFWTGSKARQGPSRRDLRGGERTSAASAPLSSKMEQKSDHFGEAIEMIVLIGPMRVETHSRSIKYTRDSPVYEMTQV